MGLTPLGGVVMGTRSGDLDPGIVQTMQALTETERLTDVLYHECGLLALSDGSSSDMQTLLGAGTASARFAIDYFCRSVAMHVGSLAAISNGIDAMVFTGGIGEHAPAIRADIANRLGFLGFRLSPEANRDNRTSLQGSDSIPVLRVAANEEAEMEYLVRVSLPG